MTLHRSSMPGPDRPIKTIGILLTCAAIIVAAAVPSDASAFTSRVLRKGLELVVAYGLGKVVDHSLGLTCQEELEAIKVSLEEQVKRSGGRSRELEAELGAVESTLGALNEVLNSSPTAERVAELERRVAADIQNLLDAQRKHRERIERLENARAKDAATTSEILKRLKVLEEQAEHAQSRDSGPAPHSFSTGDDSPRLRADPALRGSEGWRSPPLSRRPAPRTGVTLHLLLEGSRNRVWIREVGDGERAHVGTFELGGENHKVIYYLSHASGSVVIVTGSDNTVCIPRHMEARVRVVHRGAGNKVVRNCLAMN